MKLLQGIKDNDLLKDLYFFCQNMRNIYYFKGVEEDEKVEEGKKVKKNVIVEEVEEVDVDETIEGNNKSAVKKFNLLLQNYKSICNLSLQNSQTMAELQKINLCSTPLLSLDDEKKIILKILTEKKIISIIDLIFYRLLKKKEFPENLNQEDYEYKYFDKIYLLIFIKNTFEKYINMNPQKKKKLKKKSKKKKLNLSFKIPDIEYIPKFCFCPISKKLMTDPIISFSTGNSYDKDTYINIMKDFKKGLIITPPILKEKGYDNNTIEILRAEHKVFVNVRDNYDPNEDIFDFLQKIPKIPIRVNYTLKKVIEHYNTVKNIETEIPEDFNCPISLEPMTEPYVLLDGISYNKDMIDGLTRIKKGDSSKIISPSTREHLDDIKVENKALKKTLEYQVNLIYVIPAYTFKKQKNEKILNYINGTQQTRSAQRRNSIGRISRISSRRSSIGSRRSSRVSIGNNTYSGFGDNSPSPQSQSIITQQQSLNNSNNSNNSNRWFGGSRKKKIQRKRKTKKTKKNKK